jgi:hypothetical protein
MVAEKAVALETGNRVKSPIAGTSHFPLSQSLFLCYTEKEIKS